jgi:hypothetical protein
MILAYNPYWLSYVLKYLNDKSNEFYIDENIVKKYLPLTLIGNGISDRSGNVPMFLKNWKIISPLPKPRKFTKSAEQILQERATEIIKRGKHINLLYSGGTDSCAVLCALIECGVDKEQLNIILGYNSILEYPYFFHKFIENKYNYQLVNTVDIKTLINFSDRTRIYLTGECGDFIFGNGIFPLARRGFQFGEFNKDYKKYVDKKWIDLAEPSFKSSYYEIKTLADFMWWWNFCWFWQVALTRPLVNYNTYPLDWQEIDIAFFNTEEFQLWSMSNPEERMTTSIETYKLPLKKYIYKYTKDEKYLKEKFKVSSTGFKFKYINWLFLTEDSMIVFYKS